MLKYLASKYRPAIPIKQFCENFKHIYIIKDELKIIPNTEIKVVNNKISVKYLQDEGKINANLYHYFLPKNYPESVKDGYNHFSKWSFLASVSFFVMNFISTQVLINSLDIRGTKSYFLNAGLSWVIKEGLGQIGAIIFVGKIGNKFDRNIKQWRYISLSLWNFGMILDTFAMIYPQHFLLIASIGSICIIYFILVKFIALSANATARLGLLNTFAKNGNVTDLLNTWSNQNNLAFFLGNLIGLCLSFVLPKSFPVILGSIIVLTLIHLRGVYVSVFKTIMLRDYNLQRAYFQVRHYLKYQTLAGLEEINFKETIFFRDLSYLKFSNYPLDKLLSKNDKDTLSHINLFSHQKFCVSVRKTFFGNYKIYTYMRLDAEDIDIFIALLYSIRLHDTLINQNNTEIITALNYNIEYINKIDRYNLVSLMKNLDWNAKFHKVEEKYMRYHIVN